MTRVFGTNGKENVTITPVTFGAVVKQVVDGDAQGVFNDINTAKRSVSRHCGSKPHRWTWTEEKENGETP